MKQQFIFACRFFNRWIGMRSITLILILSYTTVSAQWQLNNIPLDVDEVFTGSWTVNKTNGSVYAITELEGQNFIRISSNSGFPFDFGFRYYDISIGMNDPGMMYDLFWHDDYLYLLAEGGFGRFKTTNPVSAPPGPWVFDELNRDNTPGKLYITGSRPWAYVYNNNNLSSIEVGIGSFFFIVPSFSLPSSLSITDMVASASHLYISTSNTDLTKTNNDRMVNRYDLVSSGTGQITTSTLTFSDTGISMGSGRRNATSLAIAGGNLLVGTRFGVVYTAIPNASMFFAPAATSGIPTLFDQNVIQSVIRDIATASNNVYVSTADGVAYTPDGSGTNQFRRWRRYNNGYTGNARSLLINELSTDFSIFALDENNFEDVYKSKALGPSCYISADHPASPFGSGCRFNIVFSSNGVSCSGASIQYLWSTTPSATITNATGPTATITFPNNGTSYKVRLNVKATNYGINDTYEVHYSTLSPTAIPSTQASGLGSSTNQEVCGMSLLSQQMSAYWSRGNGNRVVVIARVGGTPGQPSNGELLNRIQQLNTGTFTYGLHDVLDNSNNFAGYVVYIGTGTSMSTSIPLSHPLTILGLNSNLGIRVIEVNYNGCFVNFSSSTPTKYLAINTFSEGCPRVGPVNIDGTVQHQSARTSVGIQLENLSEKNQIENVVVYDVHGKVLATAPLLMPGELKELPLNGFRGMALIRFQQGGKVKNEKMVID